jgi:hypothetical protein
MDNHEQRLLEIETARVRHAWAKTQIKDDGATPALTKYLRESLKELAALRANDGLRVILNSANAARRTAR